MLGTATITTGQVSLVYTAPALLTGESAITTYKYSTDGGITYTARTDSKTTASPIVITKLSSDGTTALTNGTTYNISVKAVNANCSGIPSNLAIGGIGIHDIGNSNFSIGQNIPNPASDATNIE